MRFLADESCDFAIVRALRAAGHEVLAVAEAAPSAGDPDVLRLALGERRILLTEDKDFGGFVFAHGHRAHAVLLLRYPRSVRGFIASEVVRLVAEQGDRLLGCFVVIRPGRIRITRPPGPL
jgi:predicted nuclease of predicted toxin-antitoxin system